MATREGRFKTPTTGSRLLIGTAIEIDFANPGYLKQGGAGARPVPGVSGILIYEDQFLVNGPMGSINSPLRVDSSQLAFAQLGRYAVLTTGAGCKFWFKNVASRTTPDGFPFPAISPVAGLGSGGVALGDYLGWNGSQWATVGAAGSAAPDTAFFQVVTLNDSAASLEATLLK